MKYDTNKRSCKLKSQLLFGRSQLLRIEGVVSVTDPYGCILGFLDRTNNNNSDKKENTKNSEGEQK
jgi:hypothetical protein